MDMPSDRNMFNNLLSESNLLAKFFHPYVQRGYTNMPSKKPHGSRQKNRKIERAADCR